MAELNFLVRGSVRVRVEILDCDREFFVRYADFLISEFDRAIRFALVDYEYSKRKEND